MKFNIVKNRLMPLLLLTLLINSCKDENTASVSVHNPSRPVEITGFEPKEGGARTRLYIQGKNFGSNINEIKVKIGGLPSKVIGSNGEIIYCMVPFKASEGTIEVTVGENGTSVTAPEKFKYVPNTLVTTVAGKVDETGKVEVKDGSFDEAGFAGPGWLTVDPIEKNKIYVVDGAGLYGGTTVRQIDTETREVSTLLTKGQGNWDKIRGVEFLGPDTMLIINQQDIDNANAISYTLRRNGFKKPQPLILGRYVPTAAVHPNGEIYYASRKTGMMYRYDVATKVSTELYKVGGNDAMFFIIMHPTGNYAYITFSNWRTILKVEYDWENRTLKNYNVFCGTQNSQGWVDGQGTNAKLGNPAQGVFVKNEEYVRQGKEDVYDFYFADATNHCIRYVTPDGFVHTYAGRGSQGINNRPEGYVDGDLRQEARFNYPFGLYYDDVNKIMYVGDISNYRIRNIMRDE